MGFKEDMGEKWLNFQIATYDAMYKVKPSYLPSKPVPDPNQPPKPKAKEQKAPLKGILRNAPPPKTKEELELEERERRLNAILGHDFSVYPKNILSHRVPKRMPFVPKGWYPGMPDPDIDGPITYAAVNNIPTPNRYYREPSRNQFPHPGIPCVVRSLRASLKENGRRFEDYLVKSEVLNNELWDTEDQDGLKEVVRQTASKYLVQQAQRDQRKINRDYHVFGGRTKTIYEKAAAPISILGWSFKVPIAVRACIEEINRRGLKEPDLFKRPGSHRRILELVNAYDTLDPNASLPDLRNENIHNVANLLGFWLNDLPAPIMHRIHSDAFMAWCVEPTAIRVKAEDEKIHTKRHRHEDGGHTSETDSEAEALDEDDEEVRLPSFNNRRKRAQRKQRAYEHIMRQETKTYTPELVVRNRPSHRQRRMRLWQDQVRHETPQIDHARHLAMLLAPHNFAIMVYLFTFFASLLDNVENKVTVDLLADRFAWKLVGGPNKYVAKDILIWLLTRWNRIARGYMSEEATEWELDASYARKKRQDAAAKAKKAEQSPSPSSRARADSASSSSSSSSRARANDTAPQYQRSRRGSGETDRSDVPSYHSNWSGPYDQRRVSHESNSASPSRRGPAHPASSSPRQHTTPSDCSPSAPSPSAPSVSVPAVQPRVTDFNPGVPLCVPQNTPADVDDINPWDAEDIPVITPFSVDDNMYDAEDEDYDEDEEGSGNADQPGSGDWNRPQHAEFEAIESLLQPKAAHRTPSVCTAPSVYSQDDDDEYDDILAEIISGYTDDSRKPQPEASREDTSTDDSAQLKLALKGALRERELAQKKLEDLSRKMLEVQLR